MFVDNIAPEPDRDSGSIRSINLIRILLKHKVQANASNAVVVQSFTHYVTISHARKKCNYVPFYHVMVQFFLCCLDHMNVCYLSSFALCCQLLFAISAYSLSSSKSLLATSWSTNTYDVPNHETTVHVSQKLSPREHSLTKAAHRLPRQRPLTPGGRRLRVLFYTNYHKTYNVFMDRFFVHQYLAAKQHPHIEATFWGVGFKLYNDAATVEQNLVQRFGSIYFDVLYVFGIVPNHEIVAVSSQTAVMLREHECWDQRCAPFITGNNVSIGLFPYAQEIIDYANISNRRVFAHSPHAAHVPYFYNASETVATQAARSVSVLLAGARTPEVYPLRHRFSGLLDQFNNSLLYKHPGYEIHATGAPAPDEPYFEEAHPIEHEAIKYGRLLQSSKICVMDASVYGYALQKYAQAALAGCLIVGDIPRERAAQWRQFVVEVSVDDTDDHIVKTINWWLQHDNARLKRVRAGQAWAMRHATWDTWVDDTVAAYNLWHERRYGLYFPHGFELTCAPVNLIEGRNNRWC